MSLRAFHLIFILIAIVTAELFGARQLWHYQITNDLGTFWLGILALLGGLGLSVYAFFFVKKMERTGLY